MLLDFICLSSKSPSNIKNESCNSPARRGQTGRLPHYSVIKNNRASVLPKDATHRQLAPTIHRASKMATIRPRDNHRQLPLAPIETLPDFNREPKP